MDQDSRPTTPRDEDSSRSGPREPLWGAVSKSALEASAAAPSLPGDRTPPSPLASGQQSPRLPPPISPRFSRQDSAQSAVFEYRNTEPTTLMESLLEKLPRSPSSGHVKRMSRVSFATESSSLAGPTPPSLFKSNSSVDRDNASHPVPAPSTVPEGDENEDEPPAPLSLSVRVEAFPASPRSVASQLMPPLPPVRDSAPVGEAAGSPRSAVAGVGESASRISPITVGSEPEMLGGVGGEAALEDRERGGWDGEGDAFDGLPLPEEPPVPPPQPAWMGRPAAYFRGLDAGERQAQFRAMIRDHIQRMAGRERRGVDAQPLCTYDARHLGPEAFRRLLQDKLIEEHLPDVAKARGEVAERRLRWR
jgi:hypothetical protein